jgi:hypothetical protein
MMNTRYLLPLTAICLIIALASLAFRARARRGYGPFLVGIAASATMIGGKFWLTNGYIAFAGIVMLIGASVWNSWPRKHKSNSPTEKPEPVSGSRQDN